MRNSKLGLTFYLSAEVSKKIIFIYSYIYNFLRVNLTFKMDREYFMLSCEKMNNTNYFTLLF